MQQGRAGIHLGLNAPQRDLHLRLQLHLHLGSELDLARDLRRGLRVAGRCERRKEGVWRHHLVRVRVRVARDRHRVGRSLAQGAITCSPPLAAERHRAVRPLSAVTRSVLAKQGTARAIRSSAVWSGPAKHTARPRCLRYHASALLPWSIPTTTLPSSPRCLPQRATALISSAWLSSKLPLPRTLSASTSTEPAPFANSATRSSSEAKGTRCGGTGTRRPEACRTSQALAVNAASLRDILADG